jgi:hypothetical protein
MLKKLIIGTNSEIVRKIKAKINNADYISHLDIFKTNLNIYKSIFVFSWSHNSLLDNVKLINQLPLKKVIFISTVSVLSLQKRSQWNSYPNNKKKIEKIVLNNRGSVLRLGIFDDLKKKHNSSVIPYTSYKHLTKFLNQIEYKNQIYDCFELYCTNKNLSILEKFFYKISVFFSNIKIIRKGCEVIAKYILSSVFYGYTADTLSFFCKNLQIGYGAIGSQHLKYLNDRLVAVSYKKDKIITNNGFNQTYIGYDKTGLSKYWHGVYLEKTNNKFYKKVPFIVDRKKKPKSSIEVHVKKISYTNKHFLSICKSIDNLVNIYSLRIILAAGIFENIRLLQSLLNNKKLKINLNDHEWFNLGFINLEEAINKKFIIKKWFLIFRDKLLVKKFNNINLVIEFRPFSDLHLENKSFKFYSYFKNNIFFKIIKNFTFLRLNEAFFNKFGFSLYTNKIILSALINNKGSVTYDCFDIKKKRLSKNILNKITNEVKSKFKTLVTLEKKETFDSQHINGGEEILEKLEIKNLIKSKKIHIVGFPYQIKDNNFYPTKFFIDKEKKGTSE